MCTPDIRNYLFLLNILPTLEYRLALFHKRRPALLEIGAVEAQFPDFLDRLHIPLALILQHLGDYHLDTGHPDDAPVRRFLSWPVRIF